MNCLTDKQNTFVLFGCVDTMQKRLTTGHVSFKSYPTCIHKCLETRVTCYIKPKIITTPEKENIIKAISHH